MFPARCFGIELECNSGIRADHGSFRVKGDGSVDGDGLEYVSAILSGQTGLDAVDNFVTYANENGFEADGSCGFHLHVDVRDLDDTQRRRVAYAYGVCQRYFRSLCPERSDNTYCREIEWMHLIRDTDFEEIFDYLCNDSRHDRYCWVNLMAIEAHGTIEIRLHAGTFSKPRILKWIKLHVSFVEFVKGLTLTQIDTMFGGKPNSEVAAAIAKILKATEETALVA